MTMLDSALDFSLVSARRRPDVHRIERDRLRAIEKWSPEIAPSKRRYPTPPAMRSHGIAGAEILEDLIREIDEHAQQLVRTLEEENGHANRVLAKTVRADQQRHFASTMRIYKRAQFFVTIYSFVCALFFVVAIRLFATGYYFYMVPAALGVLLIGCIAIVEFDGLLGAYRVLRAQASGST